MRSRILKVAYILIITLCGSVLLFQSSLENYWQQRYHRSSPLTDFKEQLPEWLQTVFNSIDLGSKSVQQLENDASESVAKYDEQLVLEFNQALGLKEEPEASTANAAISAKASDRKPATTATKSLEPSVIVAQQPTTQEVVVTSTVDPTTAALAAAGLAPEIKPKTVDKAAKTDPAAEEESNSVQVTITEPLNVVLRPNHPLPKPVLKTGDKIFFAGDSMMQGVAPRVKRAVYHNYKIESLDLSKQSTGLTYLKAFNWPGTVEETLDNDPSIKVMAVFLGANDPWNFPNPVIGEGQKKYLRYQTTQWEAVYRARIRRIIAAAQQHHVAVIWLSAPCMRKKVLNDGMKYLNRLYRSEVAQVEGIFVETEPLLGCDNGEYRNYVTTEKGNVKMRIDDGVHFTVAGQKILANKILSLIDIEIEEPTETETNTDMANTSPNKQEVK